ncbi:nitroreductase [Streptomyces sp. 549]|uniref:Acg family FMN-binding oxidoreductase n=1 Tax=Streptomyces sp. 549 TaxID=3049076 RepID=UPI0024C46A07|nr:nitroreductase [Streptomyces sp. 549]MDK1473919.1 nitroreductase [Streptomyces sp. 549]
MPVPLTEAAVTALAEDAAAAPSMHNTQPWRFRHSSADAVFAVYADLSRALPQEDADTRGLHLACGAALLNLRVGAAHRGLPAHTSLLPDPHDETLLATVDLGSGGKAGSDGEGHDREGHAGGEGGSGVEADSGGEVDEPLAQLYPAVHTRHTSRYPFLEEELPDTCRTALVAAAEQEGATLEFPGAWHLDWVMEVARRAEVRNADSRERREEMSHWTRLGAATADVATDGVPEYAFGPHQRSGQAPVRDFAGRRPVADRGTADFEPTPHLALLSTPTDRPADWLRAGQAMQRVLLVATQEGLVGSFVTQALEWTDLRWPLRDPMTGAGPVQMVLRLGYGPQGPRTPRRPVREVLDIEP